MIGYFPTSYPDELLYSVCARYRERVLYHSSKAVSYELFGGKSPSSAIDLPLRIGHLITVLPTGHRLTVKSLSDKHTLLPLYSPFLLPQRFDIIQKAMGSHYSLTSKRPYTTMPNDVPPPEWFRFCPSCVENDRKQFGECYWHRIHQIAGVEVCPSHSVFLENSSLSMNKQIIRGLFITAEDSVMPKSPRKMDISDPDHEILLSISHDSFWLLNQDDLSLKYRYIRDSYLMLLSQRGLTSPSGIIRSDRLSKAFRDLYSQRLLTMLRCKIDERQSNWHLKIARKPDGIKAFHPLRHILLIRLLGHTTKSFFETVIEQTKDRASNDLNPFGVGPWPCLNSTCGYFRKLKIKSYQISRSHRGPLIGIFTCVCGFAYSREVSDKYINKPYKYQWVMIRGHVWEAVLKKLWQDSSISLTKMAHTLNADQATVKRFAVRLELPFPRKWTGMGAKPIRIDSETQKRIRKTHIKRSSASKAKGRDSNRKKWLRAIERNPGVGRTSFSTQIAPDVYTWLHANDRKWLEEHMPAKLRTGGQPCRIDWKARDARLSEQVRDSAERLKHSKNVFGRPVRITRNLIAKDIKQMGILLRNDLVEKLPNTYIALSKVSETTAEIAIRRLEWATECLRQESNSASGWEIALRAGVSWETQKIPQVKAAIHAACESLKNLDSSSIAQAA